MISLFPARGGKQGKKIHVAHRGSSVLGCGIWIKHRVEMFAVKMDTPITCKRCIESYPYRLNLNNQLINEE